MKIQFLGEESLALGFRFSGVQTTNRLADLDAKADLWLIAESYATAFHAWLPQVVSPPLFLLLPTWQSSAAAECWLRDIAKGLGLALVSKNGGGLCR